MTDLAARLRDVLSDEIGIGTTDQRVLVDTLHARLLPLLSSLLEEREREIREAVTELLDALPDGGNYKWAWDECTGDEQDAVKSVRAKAEEYLSRLASQGFQAGHGGAHVICWRCIEKAPRWWKRCANIGHDIAIHDPDDTHEFWCSDCSRGEGQKSRLASSSSPGAQEKSK